MSNRESFDNWIRNTGRYNFPVPEDLLKEALDDDFSIWSAAVESLGKHTLDVAAAGQRVDAAYRERNTLVALLSKLFPSGYGKTAIEGWDEAWHNCCYIDFPWGQASWHFHDDDKFLFEHLSPYQGEYDGHTTEEKYKKIREVSVQRNDAKAEVIEA